MSHPLKPESIGIGIMRVSQKKADINNEKDHDREER